MCIRDSLQTVHQRIPVDKQLPGGLGNVQVVLKELVDGEQSFLIQRVDGVLLENLLEEHLAQGSRQLIDQAADTQIFIVDDVLFGVKDLAYLDGDLSLLIACLLYTSQGLQTLNILVDFFGVHLCIFLFIQKTQILHEFCSHIQVECNGRSIFICRTKVFACALNDQGPRCV